MIKKMIDGITNAKLKNQMRIMTLFILFLIMGTVMTNARGNCLPEPEQAKVRITGTVVDRTGESIIGANIVEKGVAGNGTITGVDGNFSLSVSQGATLVVSYIGYVTQEMAVGNRTVLSITLAEDTKALEEVVVVGYGTQRKGNLTGSIAEVKTDKLTVAPVNSVANMLGGQLAGLTTKQGQGTPGADAATLSIRGFDGPLVIVDGVASGMNNIDANQIESITFLKDGAASIYGARAGNGVILITTKRGEISKPVITVNSSITTQRYDILEALSSGQVAEFLREAHLNAGYPAEAAPYTEEQVRKFYDGSDPDYPNVNWFKETVRQNAPQHNHNISLRGGSDRIRYYGYAGYNRQETIFRHDGGAYDRYNLQSNIDARITDRISATVDFFMSQENLLSSPYGRDIHNLYEGDPRYPTSLPDPDKLSYANHNFGNIIYYYSTKLGGYSKNKANNMRVNGSLTYDFKYISGLKAKAFINYSYGTTFNKSFKKQGSFYTYDHDSGIYTFMRTSQDPTGLSQSSSFGNELTQQYSLSYDRTFNKAHHLAALVLYESINTGSVSYSLSRIGYKSTALDQLVAGDPATAATSGSESEMGRKSGIGRLNYNYAGRYLLETIFRADASAKFHPDHRWGFFPSVSLGWVVSEESFMQALKPLDNMKLRLSMGQSGYDNVGDFRYLSVYGFGGQYILGSETWQGMYSTGIANEAYSWERMTNYNAGLDFSFLKRKLYGTAEAFYRLRDGIFGSRATSLPSTFGATLPTENLNSISTRGFEFSLGTVGKSGGIAYDFSGNLSWNRSRWEKYDEPVYEDPEERYIRQVTGVWTDRRTGYVSDGLFTSQAEIDALPYVYADLGNSNSSLRPGDIKYRDMNGDGVLNWRDQREIGYGSMPHWMYGISASLKYGNFDLSLLFQGAFAYTMNVSYIVSSVNRDYYIPAYVFENRWTEANNSPHALLPRIGSMGLNSLYSDYFNNNVSYIRLKNASLGYELPAGWCKRAGISRLRLFLAGTNLLTLSNIGRLNIDPEVSEGTVHHVYPIPATLSAGLNLSF